MPTMDLRFLGLLEGWEVVTEGKGQQYTTGMHSIKHHPIVWMGNFKIVLNVLVS